jgi:glutamate-ammonia-ligase adenylyltransferase
MGRSGEIAYSETACRQYYQTWADTSDRLALIKCRHSAGDSTLGGRFINSIQDFVFKKYMDQAAVEEIRWIKRRTDEALRKSQETHTHVKLGLGGIREIEFFAQSFQILYGGLHPELRTPNTLSALQRLVENGYIKSSEYETLCEAYVFLRDLEHKLQLVHDVQTHSLPLEREEMLRCARRMGYRPTEMETDEDLLKRFHSDLQQHNQGVREIFHGLFEEAKGNGRLEEVVLNPSLDSEAAIERLVSCQVTAPQEVLEGIQILRDAPSFPHSPSRIRNLLANLVPHLIKYSTWARSPRDLFTRFDRFCDSLGTRANLYTEAIENSDLRERLFRSLASGEFLAERLIQNPELLDAVAYSEPPESYLPELTSLLMHRDFEERPEALRVFKRREEFKVALQELMEPGNPETRRRLTQLAETILQTVCQQCVEYIPGLADSAFSILALGKLGGGELIFHSDLDLVVVYDDDSSPEAAARVSELLKELRKWLQAYTKAGRAYQIDFRLRPEGRHGAEAVPLSQLIRYFEERAEPWERLAYVKARPVFERGVNVPLERLVFHTPFSEQEIAQLTQIRLRKEHEIGKEEKTEYLDMKVGKGSLLDIQFVVQLTQVNYKLNQPNLLSAIDKVNSASILNSIDADVLRKGLRLFYAIESIDDLIDGRKTGKLSKRPSSNDHLAMWLGKKDGEELTEEYLSTARSIRQIYLKYFG